MSKLRATGTLSLSNMGSESKQCRTLTYAVKDAGSLTKVKELRNEMDRITELDSTVEVTIKDFGTSDQEVDFKYKSKECASEPAALLVKKQLDKFLKKKDGQTTLDET